MDRYVIICTREQTLKAIKLDAPILVTPAEFYEELPHFNMKMDGENASIIFPTAEQMVGWLEDQTCIFSVEIYNSEIDWRFTIKTSESEIGRRCFNTRQGATIAAIDAALDYLINKKEE